MGKLYLKGLVEGGRKLLSPEGRGRKVRFRFSRLGNYLAIQWQLYLNLIRFLKKS